MLEDEKKNNEIVSTIFFLDSRFQMSEDKKISAAFQTRALNTIWPICRLYIWPLRFVLNLGLFSISIMKVNIQKANACCTWTPYFKIKDASIVTSEDKIKIESL